MAKVRSAVEIARELKKHGYTLDEDRDWVLPGKQSFVSRMWACCGLEAEDTPWEWEPEWLEEPEIKEGTFVYSWDHLKEYGYFGIYRRRSTQEGHVVQVGYLSSGEPLLLALEHVEAIPVPKE